MNALKVIIVEDETGAASHLSMILHDLGEDIQVLAVLPSVKETVQWIAVHPQPDLAFFDIRLEDGLSFDIFKQCHITFPVVFTTAYDQYAIDAFKVNSVDYLLKPVKQSDLQFSISKFKNLNSPSINSDLLRKMIEAIEGKQKTKTLLVHVKDRLVPIHEKDFAYFYLENGLLKACTRGNQIFPIDKTIEDLSGQLNAYLFFRANRQVIVNRFAVSELEFYFNGRFLVRLTPPPKTPVLISKARVPAFKAWLVE